MGHERSNNSTVQNLMWKFLERFLTQGLSFVVSILIARILSPSDFGLISLILIFINFSYVVIDGGFNNALIQKKDANHVDFSTIFFFNLLMSICAYIVIFFTAPYIAHFFHQSVSVFVPVFRTLGLIVILFGINSTQQAYISKHMLFKQSFIATTCSTVIAAAIGLYMAYSKYGVWALVGQQLTLSTCNIISLLICTRQTPLMKFSLQSLKGLFEYGINILGASLLMNVFTELRSVIIGRLYPSSELAFYDRGQQFPLAFVTSVNSSIGAVLFPKMSIEQDNVCSLKNSTRNAIRFGGYVMFPIMIGLAVVAQPLIQVLLTDKWLPCVPLLQCFCLVYLFQPIHTANMQAIKAIGASKTYFRLEVFKKTIELIALLLVMRISVLAIVITMGILTTLFTIVNAFPNRKLLNYTFSEQFRDIIPSLSIAIFMGLFVSLMGYFITNPLLQLCIQIITGIVFYVTVSFLIKNQEFQFICSTIKPILHKLTFQH